MWHVRPSIRSTLALLVTIAASGLAGCAGYQLGSQSLYRADIRTVYVPIIQSDVFRRDYGERLTEALVKEIELKTPYKVVHYPNADSVLTGRILDESKRVIAENAFDEPRVLEHNVLVHVTWMDRYGNVLMPDSRIPVSPFALEASEASVFIPEAGQSIATAQLDIFQNLAQQIVGQMETRW